VGFHLIVGSRGEKKGKIGVSATPCELLVKERRGRESMAERGDEQRLLSTKRVLEREGEDRSPLFLVCRFLEKKGVKTTGQVFAKEKRTILGRAIVLPVRITGRGLLAHLDFKYASRSGKKGNRPHQRKGTFFRSFIR